MLILAILAAPLAATADNEAVGTPLTAPPEIAAVLARAARCHDFISALPGGYQTRDGDGGRMLFTKSCPCWTGRSKEATNVP